MVVRARARVLGWEGSILMSYLDTKPSYVHITGGTYARFDTMFGLDHDFVRQPNVRLQLGGLDAVEVIPAGGMTATGLGYPFPIRVPRTP
jgi:hypothetical protein